LSFNFHFWGRFGYDLQTVHSNNPTAHVEPAFIRIPSHVASIVIPGTFQRSKELQKLTRPLIIEKDSRIMLENSYHKLS